MKKLLCIVSLAVLLCFAFACQNKAEKTELEKYRTQAKVEEQNKEIVKRFFEAWNKEDMGAMKELLAPEYVYYLPSNSATPRSREEVIDGTKLFYKGFPDVSWSIEESMATGNKVISRWIMRGTHQEEFEGFPATGNKIETSGILITRIENGQIIENREDWDMLGLFMQLGMELKPKEAEKK
jgi:steroid delta-isomerase-like uncharacterized protein